MDEHIMIHSNKWPYAAVKMVTAQKHVEWRKQVVENYLYMKPVT